MAHIYFLKKLPDEPECALVWDTRTLTVGRGPDNAVVLDDSDVSRRHAIFTKDGDRCEVGDHQTGNGTLVNGQRVTGSQVIRSGDRITICKLELTFFETEEHPAKRGLKLEYASHLMTSSMVPQGSNPNATMVGIGDGAPGGEDDFIIEHNNGTGSDLFADDPLDLDVVAPAPVRDLDFDFADAPGVGEGAPALAPTPGVAPAAAAASDPNDATKSDPIERMRRLKSLHGEGLITDAEFEQKRSEILGAM